MTLPRLLSSLLLFAVCCAADAADLMDAYRSALRNDPRIREAEAVRMAALEAKPQALAALLPQLGATAGVGREESRDEQASSAGDTTTDTTSDFEQYRLQLSQTLFRRDQWLLLERADIQLAQAEADYRVATQDLVLRTAQRYFDVLSAQDTVDAARITLDAFARQLLEAQKRYEVGFMAVTDVQEARAARDFAAAELIAAQRELTTRSELLRELTGESYATLAVPGDDMPLEPPAPDSEAHWVDKALELNLKLISSRLALDISHQDVQLARSLHYPTVDLIATLGGSHSDADRTGTDVGGLRTRSDLDRDARTGSVLLQLNVPIYSGGGIASRVRQRSHLQQAARERLERTARETERAARDAYLGVLSGISRVKALRQALESGRTALRATEASQAVGARTTVDVLDARRRLFEAQTKYSRSRYDYLLNRIQLRLAAGTLSQSDVEEINRWMQ